MKRVNMTEAHFFTLQPATALDRFRDPLSLLPDTDLPFWHAMATSSAEQLANRIANDPEVQKRTKIRLDNGEWDTYTPEMAKVRVRLRQDIVDAVKRWSLKASDLRP